MDGGEKERAVANSFKEIVKHTSRHKATLNSSKQRDTTIRIAPKFSNGFGQNSSLGDGSSRHHELIPQLDHESSQENGFNMLPDGSAHPTSPEHGDHPKSVSVPTLALDDSVLLMHFLDNIFPLQYPMYKPGILDGGRGWLLSLLLRTEPFYHAALALSAYHRRMIILAKDSHPCRAASLIHQEKHLETCLKLVNQDAQNSCPNNGLVIATAVIQLMFFELFTGDGNEWQAHLRAAIHMYQRAQGQNLAHFGLSENSRTILCEELPLSEHEPIVAGEVINFRFLAGTIIWLDITTSITAGTAPSLLPYQSRALAPNSQTKLEDIMGCKNWVMFLISRIAELHEHKIQALELGHLDCAEFEQTAGDISREIQCNLTQRALEGFNLSEHDSPTIFNTISDPSTIVTRIFGYMASIYLHLVIFGFQNLEMLDITISRAMDILRNPTSIQFLPTLVCPLYIIGAVARKGDEQFFLDAFSSPPLLNPLPRHRKRILPILEEIWNRRKTTPGFTWKEILEIAPDVLLL